MGSSGWCRRGACAGETAARRSVVTDVSSENDTQGVGDGQLRVDPGTQVLVSTASMQQPLSVLPSTVTGNVLLVSSTAPGAVERRVRDLGIDVGTVGLIPITGSDVEYDGPLWTSEPVVPDDLTGLSMRFTSALEALEPGQGWILFDALDELAMYSRQDRICRCFDHLTATARDHELRGIYTVAGDALEADTYNDFTAAADRVVDSR